MNGATAYENIIDMFIFLVSIIGKSKTKYNTIQISFMTLSRKQKYT